jgi:hypothetical protein
MIAHDMAENAQITPAACTMGMQAPFFLTIWVVMAGRAKDNEVAGGWALRKRVLASERFNPSRRP